LNHTGQGSDPTASPTNSGGCPLNQYNPGETITLSGVPENGWEVNSWVGTADPASNIVTMPGNNHNATVNYTQICYSLTLSHSEGGGPISADPANSADCSVGEYHANEIITLTADPDENWGIGGWTGTDDPGSTDTTTTVTMPFANHAASVTYSETCYTLTLSHTGQGSDPNATPANSPGCPTGYLPGEIIWLSGANPAAGWIFSSWTGTDGGTSTVTMPGNDHEVWANYIEDNTPPPTEVPPTPIPVCAVTVNLFSTSDYKVTWEVENTGNQDLRMYQLGVDFPDGSNEFGDLVSVAFEDPIWTGSMGAIAEVFEANWNQGSAQDRDLDVGFANRKLLALTFSKKGTGLEPYELNVFLQSPNGSPCQVVHETWVP
jgi:hypothetical protein